MKQTISDQPTDPRPYVALNTLKLSLLKWTLGLGSITLLCAWKYELNLGYLILIDATAYPIMISLFSLMFIGVSLWPKIASAAEKICFGVFATYITLYVHVMVFDYPIKLDNYSMATLPTWFPLVYVTAFMFLQRRYALLISVGIYASILLSTVIEICSSPVWQSERYPILLNMVIGHPVYIATLSGIAKLQESFIQAKAEAAVMSQVASIDYLTQVANRRAISQVLQQEILKAEKSQKPLTIIILDIDHFKDINDKFGHDIGDQVLIDITKILQQSLRLNDAIGRWGGEEFIIALPNLSSEMALSVAERLRALIADYSFLDIGAVTASFGVATVCHGDTIKSLLKRADAALYQAKQGGRNRVERVVG